MTLKLLNRCIVTTLSLTAALWLGVGVTPLLAQIEPVALSQVAVPEPRNLARFVANRNAAIQLGKALFWDMQLGSDGIVACASCHFHAGTDARTRNTLHPGNDGLFAEGDTANAQLSLEDFPFVQFAEPDDPASLRTLRRDDRVGAQGVNRTRALALIEGRDAEPGRLVRDDTFSRNGRNARQSTGRNAPTVINAVFNFANFHDGRANHFFNGVNPFGVMDTEARVYLNTGNGLAAISLTDNLQNNPFALDNASLASQAVGPPLDTGEMSWIGRDWPAIGRKMLSLRPLAKQDVHPQDSRLAPLRDASGKGLNTSYGALIQAAFHPEFWNSADSIDGFSQMERNFSLFFGLALQMYQSTLVADQTPFDRFLQGDTTALSESAERGWGIFQSGGAACLECHIGPELTGASVSFARAPGEAGLIELMAMADGNLANYDIGFYNIGVTPTGDDPGRGRRVTLNGQSLPVSFTGQWFERAEMPFEPVAQPGCINDFLADPPTICPVVVDTVTRQAVNGAFKTPGLRNVELTGPYMHHGGMVTLMQVVDFYARGGNFAAENIADLDPAINPIGTLQGDEEAQREMIDFLLSLTDERVRWEMAPFDHPQLFVADGHVDRIPGNPKRTRLLADNLMEIPAVGAAGRQAQGLPPLRPFLAPEGMSNAEFHYQP
ncbi:cytochrome-c peroxidase [Geoalkalibacter sp.]|uniref:cytochrome-c peroxidase n=1 Tax=Geoalkalibacter sp. TaxID=3041440 RepID=UPI00272DE12D|nr:cytochrome c peroxidase [Geoalkalibacter sp.]